MQAELSETVSDCTSGHVFQGPTGVRKLPEPQYLQFHLDAPLMQSLQDAKNQFVELVGWCCRVGLNKVFSLDIIGHLKQYSKLHNKPNGCFKQDFFTWHHSSFKTEYNKLHNKAYMSMLLCWGLVPLIIIMAERKHLWPVCFWLCS